ncbi:MAG: hypothetical protein HGA45_05020 [Chloroflexales bacterium]|nr:hypothetical protein [Chloroflexales bacterium]
MRQRLFPIALLLASLVSVAGLAGPGGPSPALAASALSGQVSFSTFLGGNDVESVAGVAVDADNNIYITGTTSSTDFPANGSIQSQFAGISDVFVIKLNPAGTQVIYATYLGGANLDQAGGIAVDATGHAYVVGLAGNVGSGSKPFPVTPGAFGAANVARGGTFVAKLAPDGRSLVYSAIIGSNGYTQGEAVALAPDGSVIVAGTTSDGLPVVNPVQASYAGGQGDLFIARLSPTGDALLYSTYLGGSGSESEFLGRIGVAVAADGAAYVTGVTRSTDMPLKNPAQATGGDGLGDAYLASLSADGALRFATYLGGENGANSGGVVVAPWGEVIVAGFTQSDDFPRPAGPIFGTSTGASRSFVTRLGANDGAIRSTTLIAGGWYVQGAAIDAAGRVTIVGRGPVNLMPIRLAHQPVFGGVEDGFVVQLSGDGGRLIYSSFIGGDYFDRAYAVAARPDGGVVVGGETRSAPGTFALVNPVQPTYGGDIADGFVRALDVIHEVAIPALGR